jgi:hypothetical protein
MQTFVTGVMIFVLICFIIGAAWAGIMELYYLSIYELRGKPRFGGD